MGAPISGCGLALSRTLLAVALAAAFGPVAAQAPAAGLAPAAAPVFSIRGFQVTGDNPLGEGETSRILAPYLRANATMDTLQQATTALEKALRDKGYGLHRVALPPQEVGDTVKLEIVKFTISKVAIEGQGLYDQQNIRRSLPELREGHTPNFKRLAIQTAIANENPNKQIQLGIREAEEPDKIDATITAKESRPWTFGVSASNAGSESSGQDRVTLSGGHTNLFNRDHQFVGAYTTSLERMSDVKQIGLSYKVPLYELGGVIGASYTNSDVVGNFGAFTSTGAGHTFGLSYTLYLPPEGGRRSYVTLGIEDKVFDASKINEIVVPGQLDRRSRPVVVGYNARTESDAAVWGYNLDLAVNTGSGANNDLASYQSEDPRITTTRWMALRGGINYTMPLAQTWLLSARAAYQYSPDVLISGEQFGLGGLTSVRGSEIERPVSGDKGLSGTVEITSPEVLPGLRFLGFVDAGWIGNNRPNGANKPSNDRLSSIGLGLRYSNGPFAVAADYGRLLTGSRVAQAINSASPQKGDDKFYVSASVRF
ncbi:MAG TPA: ShlB/FhaC/HecB family hemolysin secretion/activation protein [Ramlibacter sp.]|nr:ShlB/FhaC/HecB family hemolysin secretion/activation protein [Ramlibacter sp.]